VTATRQSQTATRYPMARRPRTATETFSAPTCQDPEAEKVSRQIDEELRVCLIYPCFAFGPLGLSDMRPQKEADRLKRNKHRQVKGACRPNHPPFVSLILFPVMLVSPSAFAGFSAALHHRSQLGQAESGKSTLQKQFQLHYAAKTLERERPTWRPIVLLNIIQAVRSILEELDFELFSYTQPTTSAGSGLPSSSSSSSSVLAPAISDLQRARWKSDLAQIRTRLLPLTAIEESLASDLVGGAMVPRGRTGFVRAGWQSVVSSMRPKAVDNTYTDHTPETSNLAIKALAMVQDDVARLWNHSAVKKLIKLRKIVLQESAA
jgi:hypothetical protein